MSKLVAFFSATGVTKAKAEACAAEIGADLFEIVPEEPYTKEDLDYTNTQSRSTLEMADVDCRPAMKESLSNAEKYDTIYLGFPVWWGREPSIIDTFIDSIDMTGKKIIPFYTSAQSGMEGAVARITELTAGKATVEA